MRRYFEQEGFAPVKEMASQLQIDINCIYRTITDDLVKEVEDTVEEGKFDFLLVDSTRSLFTADRTIGVVQRFLHEIDTEIGILVDRGLDKIKKLLLLLNAPGNMALLPCVQRFAEGGAQHLTVLQTDQYLSDEKNLIRKNFSKSFTVNMPEVASATIDWPLKSYDLVLIGKRTYEKQSNNCLNGQQSLDIFRSVK